MLKFCFQMYCIVVQLIKNFVKQQLRFVMQNILK